MANDPSQSESLPPADAAADMVFVPGSVPGNGGSAAGTSSEQEQRRNRPRQKAESNHRSSDQGNQRVDKPKRSSSGNSTSHDDKLVDQTKQQIRQLVTEISELARTDCSVQDFYQGFLTRTTGALASEGGAIWIRESAQQPLKIRYHVNLKQTVLATDTAAQKKHSELLKRIVDAGEPEVITPYAESSDPSHGGNPTDKLLIFGPIIVNHEVIGLVEILQRPGAGPTTQRGYLRFLMQMCELASEFLTNEKIRSFRTQQSMWGKFDQFVQTVYGSLDASKTAYSVANEGRRVIDCDRVTVLLGRGRSMKVRSISGLDSIERRSDQVKHLTRLGRAVVKGRTALWYDGSTATDENLPPQIQAKLHPYIDRSHSKLLAVIPLFATVPPDPDSDLELGFEVNGVGRSGRSDKPVGALVVERLKDSKLTEDFKKRVEAVVGHSEVAITNALEHNAIFLMPLWKAIGKVMSAFKGGNLLKTMFVSGTVVAAALCLCWVPWPFSLAAKGALIPEVQSEVYAQSAGVMEELFVSDQGDTPVKQGQVLARMSNNDLAVAIENLRNSIVEAETRQAINESLRAQDELSEYERQTIEIEIEQARQEKIGLREELKLRLIENAHLEVVAPASGTVVNWQARQNLINRPVERGQNLMTIVDPDSNWLLELELPERRLGHLMSTLTKSREPLQVTFAMASMPNKEFEGQLHLIDHQLDVHSDQGNTCLVRVAFDNRDLEPEMLRTGTRVNASIACGTRSIGYVMFHEVIETVQSKWMLWF